MKIYSCWSLGNMYEISSELPVSPDHYVRRRDYDDEVANCEDRIFEYKSEVNNYKAQFESRKSDYDELTRQNKVLREALLSCDLNYKMDSSYLQSIIAISDSHSSSDKNLARISLIVREALKSTEENL